MTISLLGALEIVVRTDPGLVREQNEDSVFADANHGLAILADGMGGYNAGEVASSMATTLLSARLGAAFRSTAAHQTDSRTGQPFARQCLLDQIAAVNLAIFRASEGQSQFGGMGTTLVAAVFCNDQVVVAHVGDSRLYRLRGEEFVAMTHDHSVLQEQIDSGLISAEEAQYSPHRNLVTRAVGVEAEVDTEIHVYPVRPGMSICSAPMASTIWSMRNKSTDRWSDIRIIWNSQRRIWCRWRTRMAAMTTFRWC